MKYSELLNKAIREGKITKENFRKCHSEVHGKSIESLGWERFLHEWNDEFLEQFFRTRLEFGWYPSQTEFSVDDRIPLLNKYGLDDSYLDIFEGGLQYSKDDLSEYDSEVGKRVRKIRLFSSLVLKEKNGSDDIINHLKVQKYANFEFDIDDAIIVNRGLFFKPVTENEITFAIQNLFDNRIDKTLAIHHPPSLAQAKELLSNKQFYLPKDYQEFLSISNGWLLKSSVIAPKGYWSKEIDQIILPLHKVIYFGNIEMGYDLFNFEVWEDFDADQYKRIPTSLIFSIHGGGARVISCFDFANAGKMEGFIYSLDISPESVDEYANFTDYMEKKYVDSIAQVRCEYEELLASKRNGDWINLKDRK